MKTTEKVLVEWFPHGNQGQTDEIGVFEMEVTVGPHTLETRNGCESPYFIQRECRTVETIGKTWILQPSHNYNGVNWQLCLASAHGREFISQLCPHCKRLYKE